MDRIKILFCITLVVLLYMIWRHSWKIQLMYNSVGTSMYTPESFPIDPGHSAELKKKFADGRAIAGGQKIIITGLLRDAMESLPAIKKKVERAGAAFLDYRVLLVENNSTDGTREELLKWAKVNPRVTILGCGVNAEKCVISKGHAAKKTDGHSVYRGRIQKMVDLRNIYLDHIKSRPELRGFDYSVVWDLDTIGVTYLDGLFTTIYDMHQPGNKNLSAVCAHGIYRWLGVLPLYYDTYAHLEHNDDFHIDNKLSHDISTGISTGAYTRGQPLVPVKSCFSGFTVYRTKDLLPENVRYTMTPESSGNLECEHVRLHGTLSGKMAMNPSMINLVLLNR